MPRKRENLQIVTIRLNQGDAQRLTDFYPNLGYNRVIRVLVAKHLEVLDQRVAQTLPVQATPDISGIEIKDLEAPDGES